MAALRSFIRQHARLLAILIGIIGIVLLGAYIFYFDALLQIILDPDKLKYGTTDMPLTLVLLSFLPVALIVIAILIVLLCEEDTKISSETLKDKHHSNPGNAPTNLKALQTELEDAHRQIDAQEKLASVGILSAGIAHEIKNPLNFINNFSETTIEILTDLKEALKPVLEKTESATKEDVEGLIEEIGQNCEKIISHGKRAESIIKNMLIQARTSHVDKEPVDLNALLDEFVNLAYHGMRAQDSQFNAKIEKHLDPKLPILKVSPQSLGRVFLNLINNALYAINEKAKILREKGKESGYMPTITINSSQTDTHVIIKIRDNGEGIPNEIQPKIFERFFTTKPAGHGTGLGLPICHDIVVKEHNGKLSVKSTPHEFTEFIIELPKQ